MEFNYTTGNWKTGELRRGTYDKPREQWDIVPIVTSDCGLEPGNGPDAVICELPAGGGAFRIGQVNGSHNVSLEEARANAALVAAAPRLARALAVMVLDARIRAFLMGNDPKAFEQAHDALVIARVLV